MSFCFLRDPRPRLAVLTLVALIGCTAFESQVDEFPDAGPDGPDSTYAGVGRGIPFGEFGLELEEFQRSVGAPFRAGAQAPPGA